MAGMSPPQGPFGSNGYYLKEENDVIVYQRLADLVNLLAVFGSLIQTVIRVLHEQKNMLGIGGWLMPL